MNVPAALLHSLWPGNVGRQRFHRIAGEPVKQLAQVSRARPQVRGRVQQVLGAQHGCRLRHKLHQPLGATGREGSGIEAAFGLHYAGHEVRIHLVRRGGAGDQSLERTLVGKTATRGCLRDAGRRLRCEPDRPPALFNAIDPPAGDFRISGAWDATEPQARSRVRDLMPQVLSGCLRQMRSPAKSPGRTGSAIWRSGQAVTSSSPSTFLILDFAWVLRPAALVSAGPRSNRIPITPL
jgi:hypothetical protein